ncbi:hypothetical protein [Curvivirga sp.]|uniref:hypothetical protein n=1 Tax=Curvivirga sp. TaxID=2856848 RepID=UPI003B5B542C
MDYQTQTIHQMKNNLKSLNPMELQELDEIITPRAAELLSKAFGHGIYELLVPLTEDDENLEPHEEAHRDMEFYKEKHTGPQAASGSEEALRKMMRDPRYWRERDPEMIEKVTKGFGRLYPTQ